MFGFTYSDASYYNHEDSKSNDYLRESESFAPDLMDLPKESRRILQVVSIAKTDIPAYLHNSGFYLSLQDDEENETISIPSDCMKLDNEVNSPEDLRSLLLTLRFWVASCFLNSILDYVLSHPFASKDILSEFFQDFPNLVYIKSLTESKTPMVPAIKSEVFELVEYFLKKGHDWPEYAVELIARGGNVEIMNAAIQGGCFITRRANEFAAGNGNLVCLRFLHEHGSVFNQDTITAAAKGGHLNCLIYAHQQGLLLDGKFYTYAVSNNKFEMLQYLYENGCPWTTEACIIAATSGRLQFFQYMHEHGCPWDTRVCSLAVNRNQLAIVLYMLRNGCPPSENIWEFTGDAFHQILQCFVEVGLLWSSTPKAMLSVINSAFLEGLQCLVENGCPWHPQTTTEIARSRGNLDMLQYVHEKGCPWSEDTCVWTNSIECLVYAHTHGAPIPTDTVMQRLEPINNPPRLMSLECFKYLHQHCGCALESAFTYYAARDGRFDILKYLYEQGCEWNPSAAVASAAHRHADCLGFILSQGGVNTQNVYDMAMLTKCDECMEIVRKYPCVPDNYDDCC